MFLQLAKKEAQAYSTANKKLKSKIGRGLVTKVREMQPPGRFLKRNPVTSEWEGTLELAFYSVSSLDHDDCFSRSIFQLCLLFAL